MKGEIKKSNEGARVAPCSPDAGRADGMLQERGKMRAQKRQQIQKKKKEEERIGKGKERKKRSDREADRKMEGLAEK